jgi:ABC-type bacteriocin/lantibiotic exporter with double-glycine peptidase domain
MKMPPPREPHRKPHERSGFRPLAVSVFTALVITTVFAVLLKLYSIPLTVILPTSAPVWMGFSTILFMAMRE